MKAIIFERTGDPAEVLQVRDVPKPVPRRGEVLVRMLASPINPSDVLYIQGQYGLTPQLPATPGFEGAGIVEESGGGLAGWFMKGKRVVVLNDRSGNWQEYVCVPAMRVVPVSQALTDEQVATFFVNPATAVVMTRRVLRVKPGEWLLQNAAASELGKMIIRLAKVDGYRTINVVCRPEAVDELKRLGADDVICESTENVVERVQHITRGRGVLYALDPVGGQSGSNIVAALGSHGKCLLYGLLSGQSITVDPRLLITGCKQVSGFWMSDWANAQPKLRLLGLMREVSKLIQAGTLATQVAQSYTLDQITEAARHATQGGKGGKVLLRIGTTS